MRRWQTLCFTAAFLVVLVSPTAAGPHGTDRPFRATFIGSAHWEWPGVWPAECQVVTTVTDATGPATHLGEVVLSSSHCAAEPGYVMDGRLTLTAANGDILASSYDYDPASQSNAIAVNWTGGTGRFAHVSGSAVMTFTVVPQFVEGCNPDPDPFPCYDFSVPWPWYATLVGTITY